MTNPPAPSSSKTQSSAKRILKILIQVVVMVAIFAGLLWYVGIGSLYDALLTIKVEYLALAFLMYFGINLLFTVRLRRVLSKDGVKTSFGKTLLAQYAGMLTSDVTPGRSGYILNTRLPPRPKSACIKRVIQHLRHPNHRVFGKSNRRSRRSNLLSNICTNSDLE